MELETEIKSASSSDDIQDTVDYKSVAKRVKAFIEESNFLLIEALEEEKRLRGLAPIACESGHRSVFELSRQISSPPCAISILFTPP